MPNSYTTNLNMTKPEVGADTDAWGGHLNDDLDVLDAIFKGDGTGTSVGMKVGAGKTLAVAGTLAMSGTETMSGTQTVTGTIDATGAAAVNVKASILAIKDGTDPTKVLKFAASGITTGTTRTLTAPDADGTVATTANLAVLLPAGMILPYAGSSAPSGYLLCDGSAVSRTTYATLFAVIGTTYGTGNGTTTFNLPDITGRVIAGKEATATRLTSAVSGVDGGALGAAGGDQRMHQHNHGVTDPGHLHTAPLGRIGVDGSAGANNSYNDPGSLAPNTGSSMTGITINNTGAGASQNVQPTIVLNYVIKT